MNPDPKTPREKMEARLTALLLGELSGAEAAAVRELIAHDPELARLHDRLQQAIALVREAVPADKEIPVVPAEPPKLSEARRKKLLTSFAIPPLPPAARKPKPFFPIRLIEVMAVLAIIGLLASLALPNFVKSRTTSQANAIINNLRQLDGAKQQWALAHNKSADAVPTMSDVAPYLKGERMPVMNESYVLGKVSEPPAAEVDAEQAGKRFGLSVGLGGKSEILSRHGRVRLSPDGSAVPADAASSAKLVGDVNLDASITPPTSETVRAPAVFSSPASPSSLSLINGTAAGNYSLSAGQPRSSAPTAAAPAPLAAPPPTVQIVLPASAEPALGGALTMTVGDEGNVATLGEPKPPTESSAWSASANVRGFFDSSGHDVPAAASLPADGKSATEESVKRFAAAQKTSPSKKSAGKSPQTLGFDWYLGNAQLSATNRVGLLAGTPQAGGVTNSLNAGELVFYAPAYYGFDANRSRAGGAGARTAESARSPGVPVIAPATGLPAMAADEVSLDRRGVDVVTRGIYLGKAGDGAAPAVTSKGAVEVARIRQLAESDGDKVPVLGDIPLAGRFYRSQAQPADGLVVGDGTYDKNTRNQLLNQLGVDEAGRTSTNVMLYAESGLGKSGEGRPAVVRGGEIRGGTEGVPVVAGKIAAADRVERRAEVVGVGKLIQDGSQLLELGKYDEAAARLEEALKIDPTNSAVFYSLASANQARYRQAEQRLVLKSKNLLVKDEQDWSPPRKPATNAPIPQPEIQTSENSFSTFSLNVSDVSFKLAAASLEQGQMPDPASVRSEEFINAFDYRDPEPAAGAPIAFAWERARDPFAHNRDLLRFSLKTAAAGRLAGRPLNVVLLLDNSGSMERADRVQIIRAALRVLALQLQPQDKLSVITFARTARLVADGIPGDQAGEMVGQVSGLTPQGGTNLEDAMNLAYQTAAKHYLANGINRVVLLTDGAANLGDVEPDSLKRKVEAQRQQGIALDCFGIGWEGFNDDLLEVLSRNGDGRYGFLNSPGEAATDFAGQLAGALKIAASDVKVQVEFNPKRVTAYRQLGYAKHQLTKEQFRDNTVDAAEIAAQEAGNALYTVEVNPAGAGPLGTVRVRYKIPGTTDYREQAWDVPYTGHAVSLEQSRPAMRLAASASAFAEWLVASPYAGEVTPDRVLGVLGDVPEIYGADARPKKLEWMIRQANSLDGK